MVSITPALFAFASSLLLASADGDSDESSPPSSLLLTGQEKLDAETDTRGVFGALVPAIVVPPMTEPRDFAAGVI